MALEPKKMKGQYFLKTGLKKAQKETTIWFNEAEPIIHVRTQNTDLRNRLTEFASEHPESCKMVEDDAEIACKEFEVQKGRLSFRLTSRYSDERREQARVVAKRNPVQRKDSF